MCMELGITASYFSIEIDACKWIHIDDGRVSKVLMAQALALRKIGMAADDSNNYVYNQH